MIVDDDPPELSVADASAAEGSPVTFRVTLSGAATEDVTATWTASLETGDTAAAADFTDLAAATGTVTVMAGRTTATFPVATKEDTAEENHETFTVTLSSPSANAQLAPAATATGTINDDDDGTALPELSVTDATANEGDPLEFTVTQSAAAADDVTVNWTATLESGDTAESGAFGDFLATTGMVTVTAGQTTATVTVATRDDTADEEDETFTLRLSNAPGAVLGADATATGTIVDDDDSAGAESFEDDCGGDRGRSGRVHRGAVAGEREDGDGGLGGRDARRLRTRRRRGTSRRCRRRR